MQTTTRITRHRRALLVLAVAALLGATVTLAPSRPVAAAPAAPPASPLLVTIAARSCPEYTDVTANRARNNIQESLQDLGADTLYPNGEPISASAEAAGQPNCTPMPNWTFTFGAGITGGNPSDLSRVTGTNGSATTAASTPELDRFGNPTGRSLAGAVTVPLSDAQAALAADPSRLWLQGGTPSQQLNGQGEQYGFAALRCAIDNLNGDNVEWISYPQGTTHVFCYAYYVTPPPASATIVVQKQTIDGAGDPLPMPTDVSFSFQGNVSYNDQPVQGAFTVPVTTGQSSGTTTFIRGATDVDAGGVAWDLQELDPTGQGFVLVDVGCESSSGESSTLVDPDTLQVTIPRLVAGDVVTCTFRDRPQATGALALVKITRNGAGGPFSFGITPPTGPTLTTDVTTTEADVPELVALASGVALGTYGVTEGLPPSSPSGTWALTDVACLGATPTVDLANRTFAVDISTDGQSALCVVENTFTPLGSITIRKVTVGGIGTADFAIQSVDPDTGLPGETFSQSATTTEAGTPTTATGDDLTGLSLGTFQVYEAAVTDGAPTPGGEWRLTGLDCGATVAGAGVEVELTADDPDVVCTFTDTLEPFGTLDVTKFVEGDGSLRTGDVVIQVTCTDGQAFALTAPAGEPGPWTETAPVAFQEPTVCTLVEITTGAPPGVGVGVEWVAVEDGAVATSGTDPTAVVIADLGRTTSVVFTDTYTGPGDPGGDVAADAVVAAPAFTG